MKGLTQGFKWFLAFALLVTMTVPAFAAPPAKDPAKSPPQPKNIPPVPRGIPDLIPYWAFDPPQSKLFDIKNLVVSGDLRVRPEFRTNGSFSAASNTTGLATKRNDFFVQQWVRLGFNYSISPDVEFFVQPQYAKNWGAAPIAGTGNNNTAGANCAANICSNDSFNVAQGESFFVRQAYVLIRNAGADGLSLKLGRQLLVYGNHRLFGHFDWANTGFSHDGITFNFVANPKMSIEGGWVRTAENDFGVQGANSGNFGLAVPGLDGPGTGAATDASDDTDIFLLRADLKPMEGLTIEPMWVYFINGSPSTGTASGLVQAHAPNQNRHTVGARAAFKKSIFDLTLEGYHQFGSMGFAAGNSTRNLHINAWAAAAMAGVTLPVPMSPRIGIEFNGASGDGDADCGGASGAAGSAGGTLVGCNGSANTFENLYPTNHIIMGYMDLFAWRNMIAYGANLQLKPSAASHLEVAGWIFRRQNSGDHWYRAAQSVYFANRAGITTSSSLGQEVDVIYTHYFKEGKVAWQLGYGHFFPGLFVEQSVSGNQAGTGASPPGQDWGYTQVHVNF